MTIDAYSAQVIRCFKMGESREKVMRSVLLAVGLFVFAAPSWAQQTSFDVEKSETEWRFDVGWKDANGKKRKAVFALPNARIEKDLKVPLQFQTKDANEDIVEAINAYGKRTKGVQIKAVRRGDKVLISGSSKSRKKMKKAKSELKKVQRKARNQYLRKHGFTQLKGKIIPNHARHAYRYSDDLEPLAIALGSGELKRRMYAKRALSFVQSIPYEKGRNGKDSGFRLPMSLLAKNKGDCDSKATLYLALMKAAHPSLDSVFVYIKGHAFVGLGLKPQKNDVVFQADGRRWVLVEPVGPALAPLGQGDAKSERKAKRGKIDIRRVKDD